MSAAWLELLLAPVLAFALALYATPLLRRAALRYGVVDKPDGALKQHAEPVAYLGGVAVYLAFLVTTSLVLDFDQRVVGLLLGATMLTMVGLFDDLKVLPAGAKLIAQLLVVAVAFKSELFIEIEAFPLMLALPLSVLWLVGVTNAFNIIDVSDGLAAGTAAIAACSFVAISMASGDQLFAALNLALLGATAGFLRFNWAPARIYLGDTGSLFIGFVLASLGLLGAYGRGSTATTLAPVLVLIVPILDTTLVTIARVARGTSPLHGSNDHFAVRLRARGYSAQKVALWSYGLGATGGGLGLALVLAPARAAVPIVGVGAALFVFTLSWLLAACPPPAPHSRHPAS